MTVINVEISNGENKEEKAENNKGENIKQHS